MKTTKAEFKRSKLLLSLASFMSISTSLGAATFAVTEAQDDGTGLVNGSLSWAILQANTTTGTDLITLTTDVNVTGVMKRLIDSDVTISSDLSTRTIDGNNLHRPLFVKSGNVTIANVNLTNGFAKGGSGNGSGAGMGGSLFIYDGTVDLIDVQISNSAAEGGTFVACYNGYPGGGGMFGSHSCGSGGGGGLFAAASGTAGGYGGYLNYQNQSNPNFGRGGNYGFLNGTNGGFGGGGGAAYSDQAGNGGFGGAGGSGYEASAGMGGFGGGSGTTFYGIDANRAGFGGFSRNGAGFGGGLFIRTGTLGLSNVSFSGNSASAGGNASGLGAGMFVLHTLNNTNGVNQGMPAILPTVSACEVTFSNNVSSTDPNSPNNNDNVFDLANIINSDSGLPMSTECSDDLIFANGFDNSD